MALNNTGFLDGDDALYEAGEKVMTCSNGRIGNVVISHTEFGKRMYTILGDNGSMFIAEEEDLISIW